MEMIYGNSPFVNSINGGICCYGDGTMDRPVAIVQLNVQYTLNWAKSNIGFTAVGNANGDCNTTMDVLMKHHFDIVMKTVMISLVEQHSKSTLSHLEKLVGLHLLWRNNTVWTPDNGCLTAANKLQRRGVINMFSNELDLVKKNGIF